MGSDRALRTLGVIAVLPELAEGAQAQQGALWAEPLAVLERVCAGETFVRLGLAGNVRAKRAQVRQLIRWPVGGACGTCGHPAARWIVALNPTVDMLKCRRGGVWPAERTGVSNNFSN